MASEAQRNTDAHKHQWLPLESRIEIVPLQESFAGKTSKLPYDAAMLATALKALIDQGSDRLHGVPTTVDPLQGGHLSVGAKRSREVDHESDNCEEEPAVKRTKTE